MKTTLKGTLVHKTEIFFNKEELLELLSRATDSNIVVVSTKHHSVNDDVHVSYQAQPKFLNTSSGEITPGKGGNMLVGASPWPCPYPPGCQGAQSAEKAKMMSGFLKLKGQKGK